MRFQLSLQGVPHVSEIGFAFFQSSFAPFRTQSAIRMTSFSCCCHQITQKNTKWGISVTTCLTIFGSAFSLRSTELGFWFLFFFVVMADVNMPEEHT